MTSHPHDNQTSIRWFTLNAIHLPRTRPSEIQRDINLRRSQSLSTVYFIGVFMNMKPLTRIEIFISPKQWARTKKVSNLSRLRRNNRPQEQWRAPLARKFSVRFGDLSTPLFMIPLGNLRISPGWVRGSLPVLGYWTFLLFCRFDCLRQTPEDSWRNKKLNSGITWVVLVL